MDPVVRGQPEVFAQVVYYYRSIKLSPNQSQVFTHALSLQIDVAMFTGQYKADVLLRVYLVDEVCGVLSLSSCKNYNLI